MKLCLFGTACGLAAAFVLGQKSLGAKIAGASLVLLALTTLSYVDRCFLPKIKKTSTNLYDESAKGRSR